MSERDICVECGRSRDEHHAFVAAKVPQGCKCDPLDWRDPQNVPPTCALYDEDSAAEGLCSTCQHLAECHQ